MKREEDLGGNRLVSAELEAEDVLAGGAEIRSLELGAGWPQELPKPPTREELFP